MEALFLKDVKAISSAGRRRTNNKSSHNSRSKSSTSQNNATLRTSPTRNKGNQPASEILNNCSGSSSKSGKRIQSSSTNDTSTLKRKRMSPKLKKLDSLATTSSPSSQRILEGDISPMDYRPQQKRRRNKKKNHMPNVAVDNAIDKSNGMLKEYVDQWTKSSSPPTKSTRKSEIKNNVVTAETNDKQDSSSASVISTSSHSAVDNNDYEGIVRSEGGVDINKDIELEYGQLAFMKKDLEKKMRLYQQGSTCITSTTPHNNKTVEENNKLELEYGKLSFMKQELEHKMSIYKMDAEKIDHQLSSTTREEAPTRVFHAPSSSSHNVMMNGESRMLVSASKKAINIERPDNHDLAAPSRQDVEFGARAFQHIMSERRRLSRLEDVGEQYQVPHKRRRRGYQYNGDEHDDDDNDDDDDDYSVKHLGDSKSMSIHRGDNKKKRRRKRRVVETRITRVFHEESEEAESGSTSTTSPSYRSPSRLDFERRQQGR